MSSEILAHVKHFLLKERSDRNVRNGKNFFQFFSSYKPCLKYALTKESHSALVTVIISGASISSEAMLHFPMFQIPHYFRKFETFSQTHLFNKTQKYFDFQTPKFLMTFS